MACLRVRIINGRPRHPQTQGLVEQANRTLKNKLDLWMSTHEATNWADALPQIALAMNLQAHAFLPADTCPYHVFFGQGERWPERISHIIPRDQIPDQDEIIHPDEVQDAPGPRNPEWQPRTFVFDKEVDEELEAEHLARQRSQRAQTASQRIRSQSSRSAGAGNDGNVQHLFSEFRNDIARSGRLRESSETFSAIRCCHEPSADTSIDLTRVHWGLLELS